MVQYFAFNFAPRGYALCNGALLAISTNSALFSLLGTYYGGDGRTTFALPDLRGRAIMGQGQSYTIGEVMGTESHTMLTSNMPMHTHTAAGQIAAYVDTSGRGGSSDDPAGAYPSTPANGDAQYTATPGTNEYMGAINVTVGNAGGSQPFSTLNPYLAVTATIATQGVYPPRN